MPAIDASICFLADESPYPRLVVACAGLLIMICVLAVITQFFRSRLNRQTPSTAVQGFTLNDLRQMHANGQLSKEELDQAIARVSEKTRKRAMEATKPDQKSTPIIHKP